MTALALVPTLAPTPANDTQPDLSGRNALVEANIRLVYTLANDIHRFTAGFIPVEDLVGYGSIGLIEAAERFDPNARVPFGAFARYRIRGAIFDGIRNLGTAPNGLTMSRAAYKQLVADQRVNRLLELDALARYGEVTSPDETLDYVDDVLTRIARVHSLSSVEYDESSSQSMPEEVLCNGHFWNGKPVSSEGEEPEVLGFEWRRALDALTPKQQRLMELVYGEDMSLADAAREMGVNRFAASKMHTRALRTLRSQLVEEESR